MGPRLGEAVHQHQARTGAVDVVAEHAKMVPR
jgi:hypothetical protein